MATLVVLGAPAPGAQYPLHGRTITVLGRDPTCDVVLGKTTVSRQHAQVLHLNGQYFVEDAGSTNGTFLNGRQIRERTPLKDGDRINLLDVSLAFYTRTPIPDVDLTQRKTVEVAASRKTDSEIVAAAADPADLKQRLASLVEITSHLGSSLNVDEILPRVLDLLFRMFPQTKSGEIHLTDGHGRLLPVAMKHGREADSSDLTETPYHAELTAEVFRTGVARLRTDAPPDDGSVLEDLYDSTLCVPIIDPSRNTLGVILLETDEELRVFGQSDLELTSLVGVLAGQALAYSRAHALMVDYEKSQRDLTSARAVQLSALPASRPQLDGYAFADYYAAAEKVGGDFYFYEMLPDGRLIVGIADVAGKGLPAAMQVVRFAGELRFRLATCSTLKAVLRALDQFVTQLGKGVFITCCICVLDPRRHALTVASAGHMPPLCRRKSTGQIEPLSNPDGGLPLGISADFEFHPVAYTLEPGDLVCLYTDGVTEAMNPDRNLYGTDRLQRVLAGSPASIDDCVRAIVADVDTFRADCSVSDDLCLVGLMRVQ